LSGSWFGDVGTVSNYALWSDLQYYPAMIDRIRIISKYCFFLVLALLPSFLLQPSVALQVGRLYSQEIAVSNDGEGERNRAFREALAAVIVKVSGDPRWLETPAIERAISRAQSYVEATSYSSETLELPIEDNSTESDDAELQYNTVEQRIISVNFSSALVDDLLSGANIPIWDSNRPSVLVWMVLQSVEGERNFLTADANPEIVQAMQEFASDRGLPIIFPVLDFEDRRSLSENLVWELDEQAISAASARYGADSILAGRLHLTASGELVGLWQFLFQDEVEVFDGFDSDLQSYLYNPLNRITSRLAGHFAISSELLDQETVRLRVDGIKNLNAYSALINYVENLGLVETVTTAELDGEQIELQLGVLGDAYQLYEQIALDRDLLPVSSTVNTIDVAGNPPTFLHYRWTR
jgi:hypothetical protein